MYADGVRAIDLKTFFLNIAFPVGWYLLHRLTVPYLIVHTILPIILPYLSTYGVLDEKSGEWMAILAKVLAWQVYAVAIASYHGIVRLSQGVVALHTAVRDQQYVVGQQLIDNTQNQHNHM